MFLDYHGLELLWTWMADNREECLELKVKVYIHTVYVRSFGFTLCRKELHMCIMVSDNSVLALSVVDHGFEPLLLQTKDYKISLCFFSSMYTALWNKSKYLLALNHDDVSEWSDMSTHGVLLAL